MNKLEILENSKAFELCKKISTLDKGMAKNFLNNPECHKMIAKFLNKVNLDGLIGLIPILGDLSNIILAIPFVYVSAYKMESSDLTKKIIFNTLKDVVVGIIPVAGSIIDFFIKNHQENYNLIRQFAENHDKKQLIATTENEEISNTQNQIIEGNEADSTNNLLLGAKIIGLIILIVIMIYGFYFLLNFI